MSRRSAESLSNIPDKKYSDLWGQGETQREVTRQTRASEILSHLNYTRDSKKLQFQTYHGRPLLEVPIPKAVCDIGSGLGGVTLAYRKLLPQTPILSIDVDPRARLAAEMSGATAFEEADVTRFSNRKWQQLAAVVVAESFDHIVALKTRGEVVLRLLELWEEKAFSAVLFLSMIEECDREVVAELKRIIGKIPLGSRRGFSLYEGRNYHEVTWVLLPQEK